MNKLVVALWNQTKKTTKAFFDWACEKEEPPTVICCPNCQETIYP